jgi:hypothetical protein
VRLLTAWQLYDSLVRLSLMPAPPNETSDKRAQRKYSESRGRFTTFFSTNDEPDPFSYERGIPQALQMMNAIRLDSLVDEIAGSGQTPAAIIERMYLTVLARRPAPAESARMLAHVEKAPRPEEGYADVLWVLLQSSEFNTNH